MIPVFYPWLNYVREGRNEIHIEIMPDSSKKPSDIKKHIIKGTITTNEVVTSEMVALETHMLMERNTYINLFKKMSSVHGEQNMKAQKIFEHPFHQLCNITRNSVQAFIKAYEIVKKTRTPDEIYKDTNIHQPFQQDVNGLQLNIMVNYFLWLFQATASDFKRRRDENQLLLVLNKRFDNEMFMNSPRAGLYTCYKN